MTVWLFTILALTILSLALPVLLFLVINKLEEMLDGGANDDEQICDEKYVVINT